MEVLGNLPTWAVVVLGVVVGAVLLMLNVAWLLQAKGMLEHYARQRREREQQGVQAREQESGEPRKRDR